MKAIVCTEFGPPSKLQYLEVPSPAVSDDEILVEVHACSVNFPDTLIIQGLYQIKPELPFSPGSDIAGTVKATGKNVRGFQVGDEVVGFAPYGGFAEEAVVPAKACFPKPPGMTMTQAAAFLLVYGTSYHALQDRARLQPDETLLVLGAAGGVGLTAVELGKKMGARVIAAASTAEKLAVCREYGADEVINYQEEDLKKRVKELTGGRGANVIYDPVGGSYTEAALRAIAWEGRYLVVGFAAGEIPRIPLNLPLLKGCQIVGVFWGAYAQRAPQANAQATRRLIEWFQTGALRPRIHQVFDLEQAPEALEALIQRQVKGKVVVKVRS